MLFQEDSTYCNILFQLFNKNIPKIRKVNLAEDIQTAFVFSQSKLAASNRFYFKYLMETKFVPLQKRSLKSHFKGFFEIRFVHLLAHISYLCFFLKL